MADKVVLRNCGILIVMDDHSYLDLKLYSKTTATTIVLSLNININSIYKIEINWLAALCTQQYTGRQKKTQAYPTRNVPLNV